MRIEFEVVEDHMRQYHADNADNGDDLSRQFTWLRLPDDVRRGMELGADAYLVKQTFDQRELLTTIGQLL